jgi:hypothetical protein
MTSKRVYMPNPAWAGNVKIHYSSSGRTRLQLTCQPSRTFKLLSQEEMDGWMDHFFRRLSEDKCSQANSVLSVEEGRRK